MCQPASIALCLHCEARPQANRYRLCQRCAASDGLRNLYRKRKGWTPAWDAHLQKLAERARLRLPLFPPGETAELPDRPYQPDFQRAPLDQEPGARLFTIHLH